MARWWGAVWVDAATAVPYLAFLGVQVFLLAAYRDPVSIVALGVGAIAGVPFGVYGGGVDGRRITRKLEAHGTITWVSRNDAHVITRVVLWLLALVALLFSYFGGAFGLPEATAQQIAFALFSVFLSGYGLSFLMRGLWLREFQLASGRRVEIQINWGSRGYRVIPPLREFASEPTSDSGGFSR